MKKAPALVTAIALILLGTASLRAAELPADPGAGTVSTAQAATVLEHAGLPTGEAAARAQTLDAVELAQLAQSDPQQQGGDAFTFTILTIVGASLLLLWIFTVCE